MRISSPIVALSMLACASWITGCSSTLDGRAVSSLPGTAAANPAPAVDGVPWVEPRVYEVFIYRGGTAPAQPEFLYFSRHTLLDKVNGVALTGHKIWTANYVGQPLGNSSLSLEFHSSGGLKKAKLTASPKPKEAVEAVGSFVSIEEEREKKEVEALKRKKELRQLREADTR